MLRLPVPEPLATLKDDAADAVSLGFSVLLLDVADDLVSRLRRLRVIFRGVASNGDGLTATDTSSTGSEICFVLNDGSGKDGAMDETGLCEANADSGGDDFCGDFVWAGDVSSLAAGLSLS